MELRLEKRLRSRVHCFSKFCNRNCLPARAVGVGYWEDIKNAVNGNIPFSNGMSSLHDRSQIMCPSGAREDVILSKTWVRSLTIDELLCQ